MGCKVKLTDVDLQDLIFETASPVETLEATRCSGDFKGGLEQLLYASIFLDWNDGMKRYVKDLRAVCCYC